MLLYFPEHKIKYVKIPKNACSTVINSLGWSQVQDRSPHQFDHIFRSTSEDTSDWHCLAVLRDPYERLVSAYLNKLVIPSPKEPFAGKLLDTVWQNRRGQTRPSESSTISFREFVEFACAREDAVLDQHWQSQTYHLHGATPTVVIDMEALSTDWQANEVLKDIELKNFAPHATRSNIEITKDLSRIDGSEIAIFRKIADQFPPQAAFKNPKLEALVRNRYAEDYKLRETFGL
ncbi:sulfotransferase family protein [Pacificibacter maritimus]|uniref:Sulfotransferase family protein n=1 Tax=Pacificibacter maritimus TaxID=762213 RepID=A0A3N4UGY7_9RHOB|nr:sulfotransferase family 2 domain-containing protein [Pacificibacter maritimus]RPE66429.1 sulfotransferase family protein [Pacificibacter maritimus]